MSAAIGGLAQGFAQGLNSGISLGRAGREAVRFEMERPVLELEAEKAKRKQDAQKQFQEEWGQWTKTNLMDADGNPLPEDQMPSELVRRAAFFNINTKAHVDNNAWEPEQIAKMAELGNGIKKEGIINALDVFMRTGDSNEALKVYNSVGKGRAPEGTTLRMIQEDPDGPRDVGIFAPDGKMIGTMNQALFMMSADNVAKHYADMQKTTFQEKQATKRTGISAGATIEAAKLNNAGAMDRTLVEADSRYNIAKLGNANKKIDDPMFEQVQKVASDIPGKLAGNPNFSVNPVAFNTMVDEISAKAYDLLRTGKASSAFSAVAMARKELGWTDERVRGLTPTPGKK